MGSNRLAWARHVMAILEAMACGLPVVTNDIGATGEIIEHGVDGFVAGEYKGFAQFVEQLVNEPKLRAAIGSRARRSVEMKFDWKVVIDRYLEVYNKLGIICS